MDRKSGLVDEQASGRHTNDETECLVFGDTLTNGKQLKQVSMLFNFLAADALPVHLGAEVLGEVALLEDVVGEVSDLGMGRVAGRVQGLKLDALLYSGSCSTSAGVVVAEPDSGREIR